jgi:putative zinc finger protein
MNTTCTYRGNREDLLVAYLYDEVDPSDRAAFEEHIAACAICGRELDELGVVRSRLGHWTPPEPARAFTSSSAPPAGRRGGWAALGAIPAWAQVAAALLCGGVAASVANLDVKYDRNGLSVRTGWSASARGGAPAAAATVPAAAPQREAPWRADLAALERQLRTEMRASPAQATADAARRDGASGETLRRVRALIDQSERKQQKELALRIAEVATDVRAQRAADLRNIDRNLNVIQSNTGVDMLRLYRMTNDLAVRVSQTK